MKKEWSVITIGQAKKYKRNLSKQAYIAFVHLLRELKTRPETPNWPNYGKLSKMHYHCHLKKGRPTYVACWTADKKSKTIEVYYVGTHEKAPY